MGISVILYIDAKKERLHRGDLFRKSKEIKQQTLHLCRERVIQAREQPVQKTMPGVTKGGSKEGWTTLMTR